MKHLAKNLGYLRKARKLKQDDLKNYVGITGATWSNYENGVTEPNVDALIKISKFFGVTVDDLLMKDMDPAGSPDEGLIEDDKGEFAIWKAIKRLQEKVTELEKAIASK